MSAESSPLAKRRVEDGDLIFMEGDPGAETFLIHTGRVELIKRGADGLFETIAELGPGQIFGEMALATNRPRAAGARAMEDCVLIVVSKAQIDAKLKAADPFVSALFRILAGNLESTIDRKNQVEKDALARDYASSRKDLDDALDALTDDG